MTTIRVQVMAVISIAALLCLIACNPTTDVSDKGPTSAQQLTEIERGIQGLIGSPIARRVTSCKIITLLPVGSGSLKCQQCCLPH